MKTKGDAIRQEVKGMTVPEVISIGYVESFVSDWKMDTHNDLARWSRAQRELALAAFVMLPWAKEVIENLRYIRDTFGNDELEEICNKLLQGGVKV